MASTIDSNAAPAVFTGVFREITEARTRALCDAQGRLDREAVGWSRHPYHHSTLRGPWLRQKRWNAWGITTDRHYLLVGLMCLDYAAIASTYLYDFQTGSFMHHTARRLLAAGCQMADTADGPCRFVGRGLEVTSEPRQGGTDLSVRGRLPRGGKLEIDLALRPSAEQESLNLVIPWNERQYHFTSKQACLPAGGSICWDQTRIDWAPGEALAWLDYARGVWPYRSGWRWAMCSTHRDGHRLGFNLGAGWTDGTGVNENAIYLDERLIKIPGDVRFEFDRQDRLRPWRFDVGPGYLDPWR
jgi:hypothetical protein